MCGASVETIDVPRLRGLARIRWLKLGAMRLPRASREEARAWLASSGLSVDAREDLLDEDTLSISTGSSAAPFCLALAKASGGRCATIMTPSVLGTRPFSFAIVPEHDHPRPALNVLTTLGAPNHIHRPDLRAAAEARFPSLPAKVVALLLGGSDGNYLLDETWARAVLPRLRAAVEEAGAALLVTTSRRTGRDVDDAVASILGDAPATRCLVLASREPDDAPIPAMLGAATHVLVTEDSVSMVSEAATAGLEVGLLRVRRRAGPWARLRAMCGGGPTRFDALFDEMSRRGLLVDLGDARGLGAFLAPMERRTRATFDEARRAAEWILDRWREG